MNLGEGSSIGSYQVLSLLGAGGMGQVYRVRDTKLGRDVAIKVLPEDVAQVPDRLARFRREAHLLASLNHPHIGAIHGLEEAEGHPFLVLELVEGEDLSERIARGPLPVDEAMAIARQVAEALDAAHAKGIVHRDLKPGNIKVTSDGAVKVLDFGLGKVFAEESGEISKELSHSPTMSRQATAAGVILGTAAYMSPEQAKGKSVDRRADIWAFGCVFYEMLTGRKTFAGETVSETLAEILKGEPEWSRLPGDCPEIVRNLLKRCLTKDPKQRLRDIGEAWVSLNEASVAPRAAHPSSPRTYSASFLVASVLASGILASFVTAYLRPPLAVPAATTRRFTLRLDQAPVIGGGLAISPDGARLAYVVNTTDGRPRIALRSLEESTDHVLSGTEDVFWHFFSPDGQWIGFLTVAESQAGTNRVGDLKKVSVEGGAPVTLQRNILVGVAIWSADDSIVFQSPEGHLLSIPSSGGDPKPLPLGPQAPRGIWYPLSLLPGRDSLLAIGESGNVSLLPLKGGELKTVVDSGAVFALYVPTTGHIVYFSQGKLLAVPFDVERLAIRGAAVPVAEGVSPFAWDISREGTLVYGAARKRRLVWVTRHGGEEDLSMAPDFYQMARISPDGQRLALSQMFRFVENPDIWIHEIARGTTTRFTLDPGEDRFPVWSLDGRKVIFYTRGASEKRIFSKPADGSGTAELLSTSTNDRWPFSFTHEGELVLEEDNPDTGSDIVSLTTDGRGTVTPLIRDPMDQTTPAVSPDGKLIAYESNESGRVEVYVQRLPELGEKRQVSNRGGRGPVWGRDSRELFYREADRMMTVRLEGAPSLRPGEPEVLFRGDYVQDVARAHEYDRTRDRFLMMKAADSESDPRQLTVVLNWARPLP